MSILTTSSATDTLTVGVSSEPLLHRDPLTLYRDVRAVTEDCYLFESLSGPDDDLRSAVVGWGRLAELRFHEGRVELDAEGGLGAVLRAALDRALGPGHLLRAPSAVFEAIRAVQAVFTVRTELPSSTFAFGFLTTLAYRSAWDIEELPEPERPEATPRQTLTLFQHTAWYDLASGTARLLTATGPLLPEPAPVPPAGTPDGLELPSAPAPFAVRDSVAEQTFLDRTERCLGHIGVGDVYQIQIGHRIDVETALTPLAAYRRLRHRSPAPYMYLLPWAGRTVVGASPELYVRVVDGVLTMRPIAGTVAARPDGDEAADARQVAELSDSAKQRAEHVMLVDLCRNDIGRVCRPGTLSVDSMMRAEPFGYVHHLVSTVSGELEPGLDLWDVVRATFPAGTMTGAPKIRAMELIEEIEREPRGLYAGAVGLFDVRGFALFALCIRTAVHHEGVFSIQASAGVVADSEPAEEWAETLTKLSALHWALTGTELTP
ncbi:anthranilate synthase component I family protein [Kitasatospora sp. NPDC002040]|uniref:anthranilate synthase component I family protein n=1 Tax=Kitasatospora sp. NPDC002040 TaxID=3154661 RepID=UPI00331D52ED